MNANESDGLCCSSDRPITISFLSALFAPRHPRAGQPILDALGIRHASPLVIMAHAVRAILFAKATAASLRGRRSSNCSSLGEAVLLPGFA